MVGLGGVFKNGDANNNLVFNYGGIDRSLRPHIRVRVITTGCDDMGDNGGSIGYHGCCFLFHFCQINVIPFLIFVESILFSLTMMK